MGAGSSTESGDDEMHGYHVLKIHANSPGQKAGLRAFFDFILEINGSKLQNDNDNLKEQLRLHENKPVELVVYNIRSQKQRTVSITPNREWGGQGLLGVNIRFCKYEGIMENVWHVLDVQPDSPASKAGLQSNIDFIIGTDTILVDNDDFFSFIESSDGRDIKFYVYNTVADNCREVIIQPNSQWGGEGLLGCGIGYGYLHRIPVNDNGDNNEDDHTESYSTEMTENECSTDDKQVNNDEFTEISLERKCENDSSLESIGKDEAVLNELPASSIQQMSEKISTGLNQQPQEETSIEEQNSLNEQTVPPQITPVVTPNTTQLASVAPNMYYPPVDTSSATMSATVPTTATSPEQDPALLQQQQDAYYQYYLQYNQWLASQQQQPNYYQSPPSAGQHSINAPMGSYQAYNYMPSQPDFSTSSNVNQVNTVPSNYMYHTNAVPPPPNTTPSSTVLPTQIQPLN